MRVVGVVFTVIAIALVGSACTGGTEIEAGPGTVTTRADDEETTTITEGDVPDETSSTDGATTEPTTPEEGAGLTESSLAQSTVPLVTSPDDIEPQEPLSDQGLEALVVDSLTGFARVDDPAANRFLDIDAAAQLQPDPTEELPLLETRGYQGGWTRAFRDDNNSVVVVTVYDFISALEADFYLEDGTIMIIGSGGTIYEVGSIPNARGFRQESTDDSGEIVIYGITFTRNNQWYLVYLLGDPETATPDLVLAAAEAQAAAAG